jgi:hypothetical protein
MHGPLNVHNLIWTLTLCAVLYTEKVSLIKRSQYLTIKHENTTSVDVNVSSLVMSLRLLAPARENKYWCLLFIYIKLRHQFQDKIDYNFHD